MNRSSPNATFAGLADARHAGWEEDWPFDFYETSALVACCMVGLLVLAVLVEWGLLVAAAVREQPRYAQTGKAYQQQQHQRLRSSAPSYGQSSAVVSPYGQSSAVVSPYGQSSAVVSPYGQSSAVVSPYGQYGQFTHAQAQQHPTTIYTQTQQHPTTIYTQTQQQPAQDQHPLVFAHTPQGRRFPIPVYPCARAVTLPLWG